MLPDISGRCGGLYSRLRGCGGTMRQGREGRQKAVPMRLWRFPCGSGCSRFGVRQVLSWTKDYRLVKRCAYFTVPRFRRVLTYFLCFEPVNGNLERKTGFEPVTLSLARRCSTTEPLPPDRRLASARILASVVVNGHGAL